MTQKSQFRLLRRLWKNTFGQDLIEYALLAGFVAVSAGATMPNVATSISTVFSKVTSVLNSAAGSAGGGGGTAGGGTAGGGGATGTAPIG